MRQDALELVARAVRVRDQGAEACEGEPRVRHDPRQGGRHHDAFRLPLRTGDVGIVQREDLESRRVDREWRRQAEAEIVRPPLRDRVVEAFDVVERAIGSLDGFLDGDVRLRVLPRVLELFHRRRGGRVPLDGQLRPAAPPVGSELRTGTRLGLGLCGQDAPLDVIAEDGLGVEERSQGPENGLELRTQVRRDGLRQLPIVAQARERDGRLLGNLRDDGLRDGNLGGGNRRDGSLRRGSLRRRSLAVLPGGRSGFTFPSQMLSFRTSGSPGAARRSAQIA